MTIPASRPKATVLHVEGPIGKKLHRALRGKHPLAATVKLLGTLVESGRLPTFVTYNSGDTLDRVAHLGAPMFSALVADEDEFWSDGPAVVLHRGGGGSRLDQDGEQESIKLSDANAATITAYDGGGYVLDELRWIGTVPRLAVMKKLLAQAFDASGGNLPAYELRTGGPTALPSDGPSADFLGGPERRGCSAVQVARKAPKLLWSSARDNGGDEYGGWPVVAGDLVIAGERGFTAKVSATSLDGTSRWRRELSKSQSWATGNAAIDRGVVYYPTNKQLHAVDLKTGAPRWVANLSAVEGAPVVVGDQVFVGTGVGLVGLSVANGRRQWLFQVKRDEFSRGVGGGVAFADGVFYFFAENKLFAVALDGAKKRWVTGPAVGFVTPSVDDDAVYAWDDQGALVAFARATGKPRWTKKWTSYHNKYATIAVAADRVIAHTENSLTALARKTGKQLWTVDDEDGLFSKTSPIVAGDTVLCILGDSLAAIDLHSGRVLWKRRKFPSDGGGEAMISRFCTPVVAPDGTILVQAWGLHALR